MKSSSSKHTLVLISLVTAITVGAINTTSAVVAYYSFIPKQSTPATGSFITDKTSPSGVKILVAAKATEASSTAEEPQSAAPRPVISTETTTTNPQQRSGAATSKRYWTTNTPGLEDGVCEAIINVASNPSPNNPHLGPKARESFSLLPAINSITMDETSWMKLTETSGTMMITADTHDYGPIKIKVTLEKINNIWVLTDGQLA